MFHGLSPINNFDTHSITRKRVFCQDEIKKPHHPKNAQDDEVSEKCKNPFRKTEWASLFKQI
jgi:hypothetical protein